MSHESGTVITFSTPIRKGSKIKVWHCVVGLAAIAGAAWAFLF
jgi:hypothetical protein